MRDDKNNERLWVATKWISRGIRGVLFGGSVACNLLLQGATGVITACSFGLMTAGSGALDIIEFIREGELRTRDKVSIILAGTTAAMGVLGYGIFGPYA